MTSLTNLPIELQTCIANYLNMDDLSSCMRVSKLWNQLFQSDTMWEPIARQLHIGKQETNPIHQFIINSPILNWFPKTLGFLQNDYKTLIHQKFIKEDTVIERKFPKSIVEAFGGSDAFRRYPLIELPLTSIIGMEFQEEHFSAPVIRAICNHLDRYRVCYILFRIRNNLTGQIHCEALYLFCPDGNFFSFPPSFHANSRECVLFDKNVCRPACDNSFNRIQKLIQGKPVGLIVDKINDQFIEGPSTTSDGKSVLELC